MTRAMIIIAAAIVFTGCATSREERAVAFQRELPQLVAACNNWRQSDVADGRIVRGAGLNGCSRLRDENSLQLAEPAAVSAYMRYTQGPRSNEAAAAAGGPAGAPMIMGYGPGGAPQ
jgi:hypothetical protein